MCREWHLLGETVRGTYAEYVSLPVKQLYRLPEDFDFHQAAAAALVYQTAWHSLVKRGNLQKGETVLIVGAGGGVNTASVQIAKFIGAQVVVIGSDAKKLEMAESLGADILIDRSKEEDWSKAVFIATNKRGVDVVVDNVGTTFMQSLRALRKGGRLLTVGNSGGPKFEIDNRYMFAKHLSIIGSTMSTLSDFKEVMDLIVAGKLKPVIDKTYPLEEAASCAGAVVEERKFWKDHIGYSLIHRTAMLVKRFPWFETILIIVVMSISLYAALSDAQNLSWRWFTRDDAYYYFKVAQNISEGHGSTFDGINPTNGYHPLWMLICIPIFALARFDLILPLRILLLVMSGLSVATGILLYRLIGRIFTPAIGAMAALFWVFSHDVLNTLYQNGLESGIAAFFIVLLVYKLYEFEISWRKNEVSKKQIATLAVIAVLTMFSRLDLVFLAGHRGALDHLSRQSVALFSAA